MAWPVVLAIASMAMQVGAGVAGKKAAKNQAAWNDYYARENAAAARETGKWNADVVKQTAEFNNALAMSVTGMEVESTLAIAKYNAALRVSLADYNAEVLENEAKYVAESADLDVDLLNLATKQYIGSARNSYAGAGIRLDEGTTKDMIVDARTQQELQTFIIRHNADVEMTRLVNASSMGRWQGEMEAATILFDAKMTGQTALAKTQLGVLSSTMQAETDSAMIAVNTANQVQKIITTGQWDSMQLNASGNQAMLQGLVNGGSSLTTAYQKGTFDNLFKSSPAQSSVPAEAGSGFWE